MNVPPSSRDSGSDTGSAARSAAEILVAAYRNALAAADAAAVTVRAARPEDLPAVVALFERTWGIGRSPDAALLRAFDHAGNTVLVATNADADAAQASDASDASDSGATADAEPAFVGAALGFLGWTGGIHLHSHMTAVAPGLRGGGVGFALKLYQRAVCLEHGIGEMRWTFDPLIRRNAHFNLVKLGAEVTDFHPDFYGRLDDAISGGDHSDRFEVLWRLDSPRVRAALAGEPRPRWSAAETTRDGLPTPEPLQLDPDFELLRVEDPDAAARQRADSRVVFAGAFARGLRPELAGAVWVFTSRPADPA
jgi:predicted GNAT superfamily acetyltransferase